MTAITAGRGSCAIVGVGDTYRAVGGSLEHKIKQGNHGKDQAMSDLFLIGGLLIVSVAANYVLNSSVGKKGGILSAPRAFILRGVADEYRRISEDGGVVPPD
jgi:hypothetical protein